MERYRRYAVQAPLEILLIVGLGIAVAVVVYIRKNKNFDNKE